MESLTINVSKQIDGFTFSISPLTRQSIQKEYPSANPIQGIFVAYDVRTNFESLYEKIQKYIYPALTGIPDNEKYKNKVKLVDSMTHKELYSF